MGKSKLDGTSVIEDYLGGFSANQLAERYGMSDVAVRNYLKKKRVEMRKSNDPVYDINRASPYTFNEHWLDELDSPEKFYFLGFFAADGCNFKKQNNVKIKLQTGDLELLEKFKVLLESDRPIYDVYQKATDNRKESFQKHLIFTSKYFCSRLEELGLPERKTYCLHFPDYIPEIYLRDYIRRVFDGDGSITINRDGKARGTSDIAGHPCFLKELKSVIENTLPINIIFYQINETCAHLKINRQEDIKLFMDWMYKESSLYLERKFQTYQEFLSLRDYSVETKGQKKRRIEIQEKEIINAYLSYISNKEICEKYKISNNTLYRILQRNNIIPFKEKERLNK